MPVGPKTTLILKRYTETLSATGAPVRTWTTIKSISGVLVTLSGNERFMAQRKAVINTHKFYMNYRSDITITERDIFTLGSKTFEITNASPDMTNQNRLLQFDLWEVV